MSIELIDCTAIFRSYLLKKKTSVSHCLKINVEQVSWDVIWNKRTSPPVKIRHKNKNRHGLSRCDGTEGRADTSDILSKGQAVDTLQGSRRWHQYIHVLNPVQTEGEARWTTFRGSEGVKEMWVEGAAWHSVSQTAPGCHSWRDGGEGIFFPFTTGHHGWRFIQTAHGVNVDEIFRQK